VSDQVDPISAFQMFLDAGLLRGHALREVRGLFSGFGLLVEYDPNNSRRLRFPLQITARGPVLPSGPLLVDRAVAKARIAKLTKPKRKRGAKRKPVDAAAIQAEVERKPTTNKALARRFGVSPSTIRRRRDELRRKKVIRINSGHFDHLDTLSGKTRVRFEQFCSVLECIMKTSYLLRTAATSSPPTEMAPGVEEKLPKAPRSPEPQTPAHAQQLHADDANERGLSPQEQPSNFPKGRQQQARAPPEELDSYSITEFCRRHMLTAYMFYQLQRKGLAPKVMAVGGRKFISKEAAAEWRKAREQTATSRGKREPKAETA
jgi:hypothetical protein